MTRDEKETLLSLIQDFIKENTKPSVERPRHQSLAGGTFKAVERETQSMTNSITYYNPKELEAEQLDHVLKGLITC